MASNTNSSRPSFRQKLRGMSWWSVIKQLSLKQRREKKRDKKNNRKNNNGDKAVVEESAIVINSKDIDTTDRQMESNKSTLIQSYNNNFVLQQKVKDWFCHFKMSDPRFRILKFFNDVANEGATGKCVDFERDNVSKELKYFNRSSVFTVWRPTSMDAIRRMMVGEGVGKGLDIKGKSAKKGKLSAYVPFLQIHNEADKAKVRTLRRNGKLRVFFNTEKDRDNVVSNLNELAKELQEVVREARRIVTSNDNDENKYDDETVERALEKLILDMEDPTIDLIDTYASSNKYGMAVQERLFWEGMVVRQTIDRKPGSNDETGRPSIPSFQDMNFGSLRKSCNNVLGGHTRAVIMQCNLKGDDADNKDPMSPLNLVMAYEENDPDNDRLRVIPVVSDFDCFIVGSRGVNYEEQVPEDQLGTLKWMVQQTENILEQPSTESWTTRWLNVLKESGDKGFSPTIPSGGYSDPKTGFIFKHAIDRLSTTGAVRHGAECFNYAFPQELDEYFLVISDELPDKYKGRNWAYVDETELKDILKDKIEHGYTFPMNPKWVLCDPGWKKVYDTLMASSHRGVQESLDCWFPPKSGIRQLIEKISSSHPDGFQRMETENEDNSKCESFIDGTAAMDLAEQELKFYLILQRAKKRLKAMLVMNQMLQNIREVA